VRILLTFWLVLFLAAPFLRAESNPTASDKLVDRIIQREREVARSFERFHPIVETYVQVMSSRQNELTLSYDRYFVSLAEFAGGLRALRFKSRHMQIWREIGDYSDSLKPTSLEYNPSGFVAMAYPDPSTFDLKHYRFQYLTTESLGQVRCLVFQVTPSAMRKSGLFQGRIWVEDRNLTIVRFNGVYKGSNVTSKYFHFDSWRVEAQPGLWVPAAIYSQETGLPCCGMWKFNWTKIRFKAQTRFWGYSLHLPEANKESTEILDDPSATFREVSTHAGAINPIDRQQSWQRQAEDNVSDRLERVGLLSPPGEVEKVLQTVVNNIEEANNLSIEPQVRCRVLLTSNLESAVVGHTIVLSRGLIDVLPDEASLAAVLAHDLALVTFEDRNVTNYFWADQLLFDQRDVTRKLRFVPSAELEERAFSLAQEWMSNSPYKDSLDSVTQFIVELRSRSPHIHRLLKPNIGDSLYQTLGAGHIPPRNLAPNVTTRVPALPLGSRIGIDPWTGRTTLLKVAGNTVHSKSDDMPFEVTPFFLNLRRLGDSATSEVSSFVPLKE